MWGLLFKTEHKKTSKTKKTKINGRRKIVETILSSGNKKTNYYIKNKDNKWVKSTKTKYLAYKK